MLMPSETEMVENSRGVPPASAIPALAASTWKSWVMLQGVCSPFMLTTPIMGFVSASSSRPIARMKARWGARSRPSVVTRDRHFFIDSSLYTSSRRTPGPITTDDVCYRKSCPKCQNDKSGRMGPGVRRDDSLRRPRLLQRRDNGRVLELRDIHLRQHSGGGIDVEHL